MICVYAEVSREYFNIDPTLVRLGWVLERGMQFRNRDHCILSLTLCRMHEFLIIPETVLTNPFLPDMIVFS